MQERLKSNFLITFMYYICWIDPNDSQSIIRISKILNSAKHVSATATDDYSVMMRNVRKFALQMKSDWDVVESGGVVE